MTRRDRPWLVTGRSHQYEWNGVVGSRFASEERARERAERMKDDGYYDVRVIHYPVIRRRP